MAFRPTAGPDAPKTEDAKAAAQPRWPSSDWHDHLQYHLFFEKIFVQARVFLTPSLEEHSLWIFDHATGKVEELVNCGERMKQSEADHLELSGPRLKIKDGPGGGSIVFSGSDGSAELTVEFTTEHIYSWLPAGQGSDAVIHRPDFKLKLTYKGEEHIGRGYSKRYYGMYGPHWGYRFIQSSWLGGKKFLWTADATFRLGDGEAKYNYFKLLDGDSGEIIQADSKDTSTFPEAIISRTASDTRRYKVRSTAQQSLPWASGCTITKQVEPTAACNCGTARSPWLRATARPSKAMR